MNNLKVFKFFDAETTAKSSDNEIANPNRGSQLVVQVTGTSSGLDLNIQGCVDVEANVYTKLAAINAETFAPNATISSNGTYIIGTDGVMKIKAVINSITSGNVTVLGRLGE